VTAPPVTADVAVVFGSGLAAIPDGALIERQFALADFGWPAPAVAGHGSTLVVARLGPSTAGASREGGACPVRLALVHGRPHLYEGWSEDELECAVTDLAVWGVRRFLLLNACGGLSEGIGVGEVVVGTELVDLQAPPVDAPPRLPICGAAAAARVAAALAPGVRARTGVYVAVPGPQYETSAEAAWLAAHGDVVGMSTAPEVRAARRAGAELCLLSLVVNRAAAVGSHEEVLATAARFRGGLGAALEAVLAARWPELRDAGAPGARPAAPGPI
jgi:purine-nucleoside phosphorylase